MSSISRRAMDPIFFNMDPPLPMIMPFWLSRSTMIVARIWTLSVSSSRFMLSITTATEWGISSRVSIKTFSRIISDTRKRSGWSVIWSSGKYWKPSSRFSLRISTRRETLLPWRAEIGTISLKSICWRKSSICAKSWSGWTLSILLTTKITGTLAAFRRSIIMSSPLPRGSSAGTMKRTVSTSRRVL